MYIHDLLCRWLEEEKGAGTPSLAASRCCGFADGGRQTAHSGLLQGERHRCIFAEIVPLRHPQTCQAHLPLDVYKHTDPGGNEQSRLLTPFHSFLSSSSLRPVCSAASLGPSLEKCGDLEIAAPRRSHTAPRLSPPSGRSRGSDTSRPRYLESLDLVWTWKHAAIMPISDSHLTIVLTVPAIQ